MYGLGSWERESFVGVGASRRAVFCALCVIAKGLALTPAAQSEGLPFIERPNQVPLPPPIFEPPRGEGPIDLPPAPTGVASGREIGGDGPTVFVRSFRITGNTAFPDDEIDRLTAPYRNREIGFVELEALRQELTLLYVNQGYVNSGAVIPDQAIDGGVIEIQIVEGRLADIEIEGNRWFRSSYIRERLSLFAETPLDVDELQIGMQLLQQDDRILQLNGELRPGAQLGEAELSLAVRDKTPLRLGLMFDNYQSPEVGSLHGTISLIDDNLTGNGDILLFLFGITGGLREYQASYSLPLTARGLELTAGMRLTNADVIQEPFDRLDITSETQQYYLELSRPFYRTLASQLDLWLSFGWRRSSSFLLDTPFPFSAGAVDGRQTVTVLRFGQSWLDRTRERVIAARSVFSFGLPVLGATDNPSPLPDGTFFTWLLQAQWAQRFRFLDAQLLARLDLQLTPSSVLSIEQFALGGPNSIRGYRLNQLVRDNGAAGSFELRVPVITGEGGREVLQLAAFSDFGGAWVTHTIDPTSTSPGSPEPPSQFLASLGGGVRWNILDDLWAVVYGGVPLLNGPRDRRQLQDYGVTFQVGVDFGAPEAVAGVLPTWRDTAPETGLGF